MKAILLRSQQFAEVCGSLIIAAFTGLYVAGGVILSAYWLSSDRSGLPRMAGLAALAFGIINLPMLFYWTLQMLSEIEAFLGRANVETAVHRPTLR